MKKQITISTLLGIMASIGVTAQGFTEQELTAIAAGQLIISEEVSNLATKNQKGSGFVTVGSDASCDYRQGNTRIQDAISFGHSEIRIAVGTYEENLVIDEASVDLLGGYADCQAAENDVYNSNSHNTIIKPLTGSGRSAITVTGDSQRYYLTLRNLGIQNGEGSTDFRGGGVTFKDADYSATITDTWITENEGSWGGGVSVYHGSTDVYLKGSVIANNNASAGGGLYCIGGDNSITLNNHSIFFNLSNNNTLSVLSNTSTSSGGGAFITQSCKLKSTAGGFLGGFVLNEAATHGGGIYASYGAEIDLQGHRSCSTFPIYTCSGNNEDPANMQQNQADSDNDGDGDGGAIYAARANTKVNATNVYMSGNTAQNGGAVFVTEDAQFKTNAVNPKNCWDKGRCNQYINNRTSTTNGFGGAFYANSGGQLLVQTTHIEGNDADLGAGFYLTGTDTKLDLEGTYIVGNGDSSNADYLHNYPVRLISGAEARIDYTTIADNNAASASIGNSSSSLRIFSSIVHDLSGAVALSESSPVVSLEQSLIVNAMGDVSGGSENAVDDPEFVDRANNDYHIDALFSPAVDYSDESASQAQHATQDTDGEERGWDDYVATNNFQGSRFDVGADETYQNDVIFEDEFE